MKNVMWSGRFSFASDELLKEFNASLNVDKALFEEDIQGSIAHACMLEKCGILKKEELDLIIKGLEQIKAEIKQEQFVFDIEDEDIHMAIEKRLSQIIGAEVGGKLHTARSRNDQVATDLKLYTKKTHIELIRFLKDLIQTILLHAKNHKHTIMPSFTHLQHAQVISFSFYILTYAFMFMRDIKRLQNSLELADFSPLGSCACAGTSYETNRYFSAKILDFKDIMPNAMDGVSDRDFVLDLLYDIAVIFTHTSRLCEEMILFSTSEFGFLTMSDSFSTGSSIMPQKKNPDVCELIRGKTGRIYGNLMALLTTMKALPLAYNKDMQEDKELLFDSVKSAKNSLIILNAALKQMQINKDNMAQACKKGHLLATDLADYLVREKNIPFRKAHFIVGNVVAQAEKEKIDISEIKDLSKINPIFDAKAMDILDFQHSLNAKQSQGSSSVASVEKQIELLEEFIASL
ncbi:argininosuccinate lyase [Campylobacter hepaticus]|uniref:argininosuccinate lyase n=1 Tax=Campylobacter hepaticus TaxID=1813019 RepID=UPI0018CA8801|nr:argininosuccinate lyase [Campylobacter hepaticus]MCZ0772386.1 argininosuccinate lyase [Campylobacter hepaticus]MCZ0773854.1 argininosuccinate lyase [Campylobacter hepaticus]MCZ0775105.1 argininosuccinate lyase [Campylobacter hepaticus]MDX2323942.1 argininosuccinate lyase [Campylobacter hepaticus]MDX2331822.1 argininosuccinate lyase [Campylobacter hepaticus]